VEGRRQVVGQVAPLPGGAARGWPAPPYGVAGPWLPFISALDSVLCREKIGTSAFVSSNFENISCVNRLVLENAQKRHEV
jgi:hypothetical protein